MGRAIRLCGLAVAINLLGVVALGGTAAHAASRNNAVAAAASSASAGSTSVRDLKRELGYLPANVNAFFKVKAAADKLAGVNAPAATAASPADTGPTAGPGWTGPNSPDSAPLDANGAIGPTRYLDIVNYSLGIYDRAGKALTSGTLNDLTGDTNGLSDPIAFWDPATDRFYFQVLDTTSFDTEWGFSKTDSPSSFADFCTYDTDFGYGAAGNLPDYPKFGQTTDFLLIGVNSYSTVSANGSDIDWITKPQGSDPITACPDKSTFKTGSVQTVQNADGSDAWTPVPAIQTDPSGVGYVVAAYDVGGTTNGDIVGELPQATFLTVYKITKNADGTPNIPLKGTAVTVPSYMSPADAPQPGPGVLDTLDGRLTHAVSGVDPLHGGKTTVWTEHAVFGGAGSEVRWYEIDPEASALVQSGSITDPQVSVFNAAVSPDRAVSGSGGNFGGTMFGGFTTSSPQQAPAIEMVDKHGDDPQSAWVMVKQSPGGDDDFTCEHLYIGVPRIPCRWGDYSGATPDPAPPASSTSIGSVWLTNEYVDGPPNGTINGVAEESYNWQALATSQPPNTTPESPLQPLLPVAGLAAIGALALVRRRRAA